MNLLSDRVGALVALVISLTYFLSVLSLDTDLNPVNEKFYPLVLSSLMIFLSILLFIFPTDNQFYWPANENLIRISTLFISILVYSFSLHFIGFIISAIALMAICMWLFDAKRQWIIPTSIISTLTFYLVFDRLLGLNLPTGLLHFI